MKRYDTFEPFAETRLRAIADVARAIRGEAVRCAICNREFQTAAEYKIRLGTITCRRKCQESQP